MLELSLEDTLAQKMRGVPTKTRSTVGGYNPYDAMAAGKSKDKDGAGKPTDLRKLSEWIRMQRQIAEIKKQES
jgi:hypothetical protein